jgi:hypothetical protein
MSASGSSHKRKRETTQVDDVVDSEAKKREEKQVIRVLDKFKETYNGLYLRALPTSFIEELKTKSEADPFFTYFNHVQKRLLQNFLTPSRPYTRYTHVEGPHYFGLVKTKDQDNNFRTFYIFGEFHGTLFSSKGACMKLFESPVRPVAFVNYLNMLTEHTYQFLDVYVELNRFADNSKSYKVVEYIPDSWIFNLMNEIAEATLITRTKDIYSVYLAYCRHVPLPNTEFKVEDINSENILDEIHRVFMPCLEPATRLLKSDICELARFHFIDIRHSFIHNYRSLMFRLFLLRLMFNSSLKLETSNVSDVFQFHNQLIVALGLDYFLVTWKPWTTRG